MASVLDAVRIDAALRFMRTTLDLPDAVARRAKLTALRRTKSTIFWCARSRRRRWRTLSVGATEPDARSVHTLSGSRSKPNGAQLHRLPAKPIKRPKAIVDIDPKDDLRQRAMEVTAADFDRRHLGHQLHVVEGNDFLQLDCG